MITNLRMELFQALVHSMIDGSKKMRQCPFSALCFVIIISLWCTGEPIKMIKMQLGYKSLIVNMHQNRGQSSMDTKMQDDAGCGDSSKMINLLLLLLLPLL